MVGAAKKVLANPQVRRAILAVLAQEANEATEEPSR
jgi:hypothetical protein